MNAELMHLKVLLPFQVFADEANVTRIIAETAEGSFGLLPHRLDCVAALSPGILTYQATAGDVYVAVDEGVLAKTGMSVLVSVRRAFGGTDLHSLREAVTKEFLTPTQADLDMRSAMARLEAGFLRRLATLSV